MQDPVSHRDEEKRRERKRRRRGERGAKMPKYWWTDEATTALLSLWGADNTQKEIRDGKMKKDIFKKIGNEMNRMGFSCTKEQCYKKMSDMILQHKRAQGKRFPQYFKELDNILGSRSEVTRSSISDEDSKYNNAMIYSL